MGILRVATSSWKEWFSLHPYQLPSSDSSSVRDEDWKHLFHACQDYWLGLVKVITATTMSSWGPYLWLYGIQLFTVLFNRPWLSCSLCLLIHNVPWALDIYIPFRVKNSVSRAFFNSSCPLQNKFWTKFESSPGWSTKGTVEIWTRDSQFTCWH